MNGLHTYIRNNSRDGLLPWRFQVEAANSFSVSLAQVEEAALEQEILPSRYQRNRQTISVSDQLTLHHSRVAVIGCGGLGGYIIEELARLGVGQLVVIDHDHFEEHNLNRQILSSVDGLGIAKVEAAWARVKTINPAVTVRPYQQLFSADSGTALLAGCLVAADAVDNIASRKELAAACHKIGIPLVHGAIGGWYGQISTILPEEDPNFKLFGNSSDRQGIEQQLGNPSFTPALVASIQVAEICKLLLKKGDLLHKRRIFVDLLAMEFTELPDN